MLMVDKAVIQQDLADKWSITASLSARLADIVVLLADKEEIKTETIVKELGLAATTAKRYLRKLTEMEYLTAHGGNKNRTYSLGDKYRDLQ